MMSDEGTYVVPKHVGDLLAAGCVYFGACHISAYIFSVRCWSLQLKVVMFLFTP